jgi:hypothetical protein
MARQEAAGENMVYGKDSSAGDTPTDQFDGRQGLGPPTDNKTTGPGKKFPPGLEFMARRESRPIRRPDAGGPSIRQALTGFQAAMRRLLVSWPRLMVRSMLPSAS